MKIKVVCPSCGAIKNTKHSTKRFIHCNMSFPVKGNEYNEEIKEKSNLLSGDIEKIAERVVELLNNPKTGSIVLKHSKEVFKHKNV